MTTKASNVQEQYRLIVQKLASAATMVLCRYL